jgi:hypothetical protein
LLPDKKNINSEISPNNKLLFFFAQAILIDVHVITTLNTWVLPDVCSQKYDIAESLKLNTTGTEQSFSSVALVLDSVDRGPMILAVARYVPFLMKSGVLDWL